MSSVPDDLRQALREMLWERADALRWSELPPPDKSRWYSRWTESPEIGGRLAPFLDPLKVRVYIKDTLLKDYQRSRLQSARRPLLHLGLSESIEQLEVFEKPYGLLIPGNRIVAWGKAVDWKTILMAVHERAFLRKGIPYGAALLDAGARFQHPQDRAVVDEAAGLLKINELAWID